MGRSASEAGLAAVLEVSAINVQVMLRCLSPEIIDYYGF